MTNPEAASGGEGGRRPGAKPPAREALLDFALVFVAALAVRLAYLYQMRDFPLFRHLASDSRRYDEWASEIAGGDWLGSGVFYQAPLYPYFLGLLQSVLGRDLDAIRLVQVLLGSVACGLIALAGREFFSRPAGLIAGFLLAFHAPAVFFDGLIQKTVLDQLFLAILLLLASRARVAPRARLWIALGAVLGMLALTRENALLWIVVIPVWMWLAFRARERSKRLVWIGAFVLGTALVLLPVGVRNRVVGGEFALTTSQLGPNFYIGNNPDADGTYNSLKPGYSDPRYERRDATELAEAAVGHALSPKEVSDYWMDRSLAFIRAEPLAWLSLSAKKLVMFWNAREIEDTDDIYLNETRSSLLRVLNRVDHFGVLALLGAAGFVLTLGSWRRLSLLYLLTLSLTFGVAGFYLFARYRYPVVPLLVLFAGAGAYHGFAALRAREHGRVALALAAMGVAGTVTFWPVHPKPKPSIAGFNSLGNALSADGRPAEAEAAYREALERGPTNLSANYNLGLLLFRERRFDEARGHLKAALRVNPDYPEALNNLGLLTSMEGDWSRALTLFERAVALDPDLSEARFNRLRALAQTGRGSEARPELEALLREDPEDVDALCLLGGVLAGAGELEPGARCFRRALEVEPTRAAAHRGLAQILSAQGNAAEAAEHEREADRLRSKRSRDRS